MRRVSSPTFVGRAEQLAAFDESLGRAADGQPSLLVAGESGVGKSRLVGERARAAGALVLTGDCRTNRQIGQELYMSEKTASVHVSRILAKLDVGSRGQAGAVAHRLGLDGA